ncbi:MAG: DUF4465 domain-containing protein [Bacteroidales bacterium]|nr:DUF4465 domain-containing protein [Bacteroidales bacterium]
MKKFLLPSLFGICLMLSNCYNDDDLWKAVDETKSDLRTLSILVEQMQRNVTIAAVEQTANGYIIRFSDGTTAQILNGKDATGITIDNSHDDYVVFTTAEGTQLRLERAKDYELRTLTFEGNYWCGLIDDPQYGGRLLYGESGMGSDTNIYSWTDESAHLYSELPYNWGAYCYWGGGHAVSNYVDGNLDNGDFEHQLAVYKPGASECRVRGGHNGSDNFCVHYGYRDNSGWSAENLPFFCSSDGVARVIDHMYVTNTLYAANCYLNGNGLTTKIGSDDWVKIVAIGYNNGEKTNEASIFLCQGENLTEMGEAYVMTEWTKWDLSQLGAVNRVEFNITGSSDNGYGFSQPAYFAYDDVAVRFPK